MCTCHIIKPTTALFALCISDEMVAHVRAENSLWMKGLGGLESPKGFRKAGKDQLRVFFN